MQIIIYTQVYENYGAHDWDERGECPQYWKAKGGYTQIVQNVPRSELQDAITHWTKRLEIVDEFYRVTVFDTEIAEDNAPESAFVPEWEEQYVGREVWGEPDYLTEC